MGFWAQNWLRREIVAEENQDPDILMWELRRLSLQNSSTTTKMKVAKFQLSGVPNTKRNYWLVFEPSETEVCIKDPGYMVNIWITAHIRTLIEIWVGHIQIEHALNDGTLDLEGSPSEIKTFKRWFSLSHFAKYAPDHNIS